MPVRIPRPRCAHAFAVAWLLSASVAVADGPRGAEWASKEALVYLESAHPSGVIDRVLDPRFQAELAASPAYARYLKSDDYRNQKTGLGFVATSLGTTPLEGIRRIVGGGIVVVVEPNPGKEPTGFVAVTPTDPAFLAEALAKVVELARADASGKGLDNPFVETEHRGVKLLSTPKGESIAIVRDTLVVTPKVETIKAVIDRAMGEGGPGFASIATDRDWADRKRRATPETVAWGLARLDRLRALDPKRFAGPEPTDPGPIFLFGPWLDAVRRSPRVAGDLAWTDAHLTATLTLAEPPGGHPAALKAYLPPAGAGAPGPLRPKGAIATVGLWRDLAAIWEVRSDLFTPQVVQGLAQLDTFAGQFFGGRDFGSGVIGATSPRWRLVVADQDYGQIRPVPDVRLPAVAVVIGLKPGDEDFAQRLKVAFQSFVGLANLGAAQAKAPPLELGSETVDGVTISTTKFMVPDAPADPKSPVHQRQNYSPSALRVGDSFVLSSSVGLARDLIPALKSADAAKSVDSTLLVEADGPAVARLVEANRKRLVARNMLQKGNDKSAAEGEVSALVGLLRHAGKGSLSAKDGPSGVEFRLDFALGSR